MRSTSLTPILREISQLAGESEEFWFTSPSLRNSSKPRAATIGQPDVWYDLVLMNATNQQIIEGAKAEFLRAKGRLATGLAATPDDKLRWSPSETARTPLDQVSHCAMSISGMQGWLDGQPFPFKDMVELDDWCRNAEKEITTRDQALELLETNSNGYIAWLDGLTDEKLAGTLKTGMGDFPMTTAITFMADHLRSHASQLEYIQTIYGDREMRMG